MILTFAVCTHAGKEFDFFLMNSLGSYSGACSGSCLQGKWHFKDLPFAGPCWKPYTLF